MLCNSETLLVNIWRVRCLKLYEVDKHVIIFRECCQCSIVNFSTENFTISTSDKANRAKTELDLSPARWTYLTVAMDLFLRVSGLF